MIILVYREKDYLAHYGVKGMKWGHRKALPISAQRARYDAAKQQYKADKKAYSDSFNKAYSYSNRHPISQYVGKKQKAESNRRWEDAYDKATQVSKSKSAMKQVKNERKQNIKNTYNDIQKNTSRGEKLLYNDATRRKAAKYVVDNNMSISDAKKKANKAAIRNTAIVLGTYGAINAASLYKSKRG